MGIIDKLTGHSSSDTAHGKYSDQSTTTAPSFGQDSTFNEPNTHSSTQAPIVQERTHDQYNNINNTDTTSIKDRTQVQQTTQPIYDQRTESVQRDRVDHGTEVHEHGHGGIDRRTEQELSHNREKLAREYHDSHDQSTRTTDGGRSHDTQYRTNHVEEVVPVVQKDVYRPHETEHNKKIVDVHHEQPKLGTHTNAPMALEDWQRQGNSADTYNQHSTRKNRSGSSSSSSSSDEEGTGTRTTRKKGMGEKIKEKLGMDPKTNDPKDQGYSSTGTTGTTTDSTTTAVPSTTSTGYVEDPTANGEGFSNKTGESGTTNLLTGHHHGGGVGEKVKNAVSGGVHSGYNQSGTTGSTTGTSGYDNKNTTGTGYTDSSQYSNTSGSGYNQSGTGATTGTTGYGHNYGGERKQGMAEKGKEALGLNDRKDQGYSNTGTTGTSAGTGSQYGNTSSYNQSGTTGYGNNTTGYGNTTGATGYGDNSNTSGYGGERKQGMVEKGKEALGLNDRNDQGYSHTGTTGTTGYGHNTTGSGSQYGNTSGSGYNQSGTTGSTRGTSGYDNNNTTGTGYTDSSQYGNTTSSGYNQPAGATTGTTSYGGNTNTTDIGHTQPSQYGDTTNTSNQYSDASTTDIHRKKGLGEKVKEKLGM